MRNKIIRRIKQITALVVAVSMVLSYSTFEVGAAVKNSTTRKSITLYEGKSRIFRIKNVKSSKVKKLAIKISGKSKKIVTVTKKGKTAVKVRGKKEGTAQVKVILQKKGTAKKYVLILKVKVKTKEKETEDETKEPEITTNEVETTTQNTEESTSDTEITTKNTEESTGDTEVTTKNTEESTGDTEVTTKNTEDTEITTGESEDIPEEGDYKITYNVDNNDSYLQSIKIENPNPDAYFTSKGVKLKDLTVEGYIFDGWYDSAGAGGELVKKIPSGTTGDIELYARWSKTEYTIQFDSPLVPVDDMTYTVDKGVTLSNPEWFGYTFVGWTDDNGNIVEKIEKGMVGNITLHANWTSKRNQTIPVSSLEDPIIEEDEENGKYLIVYELGRIENVPLYTIKDFGNRSGITVTESTSASESIDSTSATTIAEMIANATTRSDSWTLSEEWNDSTTISNEQSSEVSSEVVNSATKAFENSNRYSIGAGGGGTKTVTKQNGVSGKVSAEIGAELGSSDAKLSSKLGAELSSDASITSTQSASWNASVGYEASRIESGNSSVSSSLSKKIGEKKGYSQTKSHNSSNSETSAVATSQSKSREYSTAFSYATGSTATTVKEYTNADAPEGYYRLVCAGTVHVFGVVGYDVATGSFFTYTYNILDDEVKDFVDYSKTTSGFDDYENGVLPFEVPYFVNEYISSVVGMTEGLKVDSETGKIVGYSGDSTEVVIPKYMSIENGTDKNDVVKITGISENAFEGNTKITSVKLPDTITELPNGCFKGCSALETLAGGSITKIGDSAFEDCTSLVSYKFDQMVTDVGKNAFKNVNSVEAKVSNTKVLTALISSDIKSISLDLSYLEDELKDTTINVPKTCNFIKIIGGNTTYSNVHVNSQAGTTILIGFNIKETDGVVPIRVASEKLTLNKMNVESSDLALVMTADTTKLSLYGTASIKSSGINAVLCKNVDLIHANESTVGTLSVTGNILTCGQITGQTDLKISNGEIIQIDETKFDKLIQGTGEWILESDLPSGATVVDEKWTYDETTYITSDVSSVEGYTLYKTESSWGDYGNWTSWSRTAATASSSRQVETKDVSDNNGYIQNVYYYWKTPGALAFSYYNEGGMTYYEFSQKSTDSPQMYAIGSYEGHTKYQLNNNNGGRGVNFDSECWFLKSSTAVAATTHKEYRYRDRNKIYKYYLEKVESKESTEEISQTDNISNVKKWVKYVN